MGCLLCPKRPVIFDILFFFSTFVVFGYADAFVRSGGYSTDRDTDVIHIHSWLGEYLTLITRKNKIELYIAISLSVNWHRQQWLPIDEVLLLSSKYFPGQFFLYFATLPYLFLYLWAHIPNKTENADIYSLKLFSRVTELEEKYSQLGLTFVLVPFQGGFGRSVFAPLRSGLRRENT